MHSINVTFDDSDYCDVAYAAPQPDPYGDTDVPFQMPAPTAARGVQSEEAIPYNPNDLTHGFQQPTVQIGHCELFYQLPQPEFFNPDDDAWKTHAGTPQPRQRPHTTFCAVSKMQ